MTTLSLLREAMTTYLTGQGISALSAWPGTARLRSDGPVAVVQVQGMEAGESGFQNYLGQVYDQSRQKWTEQYGQRVTIHFAIDLYSLESYGEAGCREVLDEVAEALQLGGPAGFTVEQWSVGEIRYEEKSRRFRGRLVARCRAALVASSDEYGSLLGITIQGGITV